MVILKKVHFMFKSYIPLFFRFFLTLIIFVFTIRTSARPGASEVGELDDVLLGDELDDEVANEVIEEFFSQLY